jgi:hypothetical protein
VEHSTDAQVSKNVTNELLKENSKNHIASKQNKQTWSLNVKALANFQIVRLN